MRRLDLSVGAWLGIGFGAAGLLLATLVAIAAALLGRIEAAERVANRLIAPRADAAARLERDLLRYAIRARAYKLTGDPRHLGAYRAARDRVRRGWLVRRGGDEERGEEGASHAGSPSSRAALSW